MKYNYRDIHGTIYLDLNRRIRADEASNLFGAMGLYSGDVESSEVPPWESNCAAIDIPSSWMIIAKRESGVDIALLREFVDSLP